MTEDINSDVCYILTLITQLYEHSRKQCVMFLYS